MKISSFKELRIWQEAHNLAVMIYEASMGFPGDEKFGLTAQVRRSATSIMANIAEGYGRRRTKDFIQFLVIARGSTQETISHCILARSLDYLPAAKADAIISRYQGLSAGVEKCISSLKIKIE